MPEIIARHSILAIMLIVTLEEANVPLPIPGDLLLLWAGALAAGAPVRFAWWLAILTVIPACGAWALYEAVRRGGRPLIERFGRYLAIGPEELARSERLFNRFGWVGIAVGRSIPFVRHVVLIACGVLNVSRRDFLLANFVGGFVNTLIFMLLGALVGPAVVEAFHLPGQAVRLAELLLLALGLPALLWHFCLKLDPGAAPPVSRRRLVGPVLLASAAGAAAMSSAWAAVASAAALAGRWPELHLLLDLARWLTGRGLPPGMAYVALFTGLLAICAAVGTAYDLALRPAVATSPRALLRQSLILAAVAGGILVLILLVLLNLPQSGPARLWWASSRPGIAVALTLGAAAYAVTTVCGHSLGVALAQGARPRAGR
jgi:membrane protein DedA with SNARE-associated domain